MRSATRSRGRDPDVTRRCVRRWLTSVAAVAVLAGCGDSEGDPAGAAYPDVIDVSVSAGGDGSYTFDATISSPYDTPDRYADAFRVRTPDGTVLGVRELTHPHQDEQPFTRSLTGVEVPAAVDRVVVEGRDRANGWGGATVEIPRSELPDAA